MPACLKGRGEDAINASPLGESRRPLQRGVASAVPKPPWRDRQNGLLPRSRRHSDASETFAEERRYSRSNAMPPVDIRRYLKHGTLPQLRVFEASARLGSFTRAAE